ncbi:bifunctional glutamate N-acetyltransferase/amino-acid acetyltransferase ArgJ [Vannielia litorea]|uniref:bifunctional glutamate N-acetyltransferase/amino-acid acetyltransferase ArgJ n=1 Tax=Vannielia litorea TaxID=1217970 RepID=UPI001C943E13|nr:bifunctional glutamate N-acetyltransferase/amino-acid acetyltransferase ArgJ [Vannielia litorea]MBY6049509.1 bifunctional glutamate N-acetyltransferase/amino-acid acetyltransferase ArgJ [Vannielia litorea]MBY6076923.1 bifunctional glutamate N-acetyltransferase/amino-acid acetyltransferase ArgJ [Vannielia litorea]
MGKYPVSPLAPERFPDLPVIGGVKFAAVEAGVRYKGRLDVMLALLDPGSVVAGVFTRSATRSAPVRDCEAKIRKVSDAGAAILVNSGNSNAFTGGAGQESVEAICAAVAEAADVPKARVFTASTGVIGERLPHDRITGKLGELVGGLDEGGIELAAKAIMTTDTFAKGSTREVALKGGTVKIAGIAKGSGMIAPDMATMLVYIFTDAKISRDALQSMVSCHNETTFNAITVDGDTSTSDTLICAATGASGVECDQSEEFEAALAEVMKDLAHQVVKDGEGATKFVAVKVTGAAHDADAKRVAMSIANSPLVKTAIAGEDPNWGRIVMAVGKSGAEADRDKLTIKFGEVLVAENGWVAPGYSEEQGAGYMKLPELVIRVDMGLGKGRFTAWTCDLTHQYISINADYRS